MQPINWLTPPFLRHCRLKICNIFSVPRTTEEYERTVALLDELIHEVGENEPQPLVSLMDTLGTLIEAYADRHFPEPVGDPNSTLAFLLKSTTSATTTYTKSAAPRKSPKY